jgi:hypothetical protein
MKLKSHKHQDKNGQNYKEILTETNHHEFGRKTKRDTKPMLLAGDIACR